LTCAESHRGSVLVVVVVVASPFFTAGPQSVVGLALLAKLSTMSRVANWSVMFRAGSVVGSQRIL
jgi:hypothetical protein